MGFIKGFVSGITGNSPILIRIIPLTGGIGVGVFRKDQIIPPSEITSTNIGKKLPNILLATVDNTTYP